MIFPRVSNHQAFTLVELLVAMAVLSILIVLMGQMLALTSQGIAINSKKLDAAEQARLVFDRLGMDLAARPQRTDLGMVLTKATGNDSLEFYGSVDGYAGGRQVTAVGYRIQQTAAGRIYQLERGAVGTDWGPVAGSNPFVQFLPNTLAAPAASDPNYEVLSSEIFRLEYCYLLNTGLFSNSPQGSNATDYSHVQALVVAVAVLDTRSRSVLTSTQIGSLSQDLLDTKEGDDPLFDWNTVMTQNTFATGLPTQAVQNIRLYQRTFYVP